MEIVGTWECKRIAVSATEDLPARAWHCAVEVNNVLYFLGGVLSNGNAEAAVVPMQMESEVGTRSRGYVAKRFPLPADSGLRPLGAGCKAVVHKNTLLVVGGCASVSDPSSLLAAKALACSIDAEGTPSDWRYFTASHTPKTAFHTVNLVDNRAFCYGGEGDNGVSSLMHCLDLGTSMKAWHPVAGKGVHPGARMHHTTTHVPGQGSGYLVVIGGHGASQRKLNCDVYLFVIDAQEWVHVQTSGEAPESLYGHTATLVGNTIYILGGHVDQWTASDQMYALRLGTDGLFKWVTVVGRNGDAKPEPRAFHTATAVTWTAAQPSPPGTEHVLIVAGGANQSGNKLSTVHALHLKECVPLPEGFEIDCSACVAPPPFCTGRSCEVPMCAIS